MDVRVHVLHHHVMVTYGSRHSERSASRPPLYPEGKNQRYWLDKPQILSGRYAEQTPLKNQVFWGFDVVLSDISRLLKEQSPKRQEPLT
jgi:hypothetical protein